MKKIIFSLIFISSVLTAFSQAGTILWQKCYGGSESEGAYEIKSTTDGGYIVAGSSKSSDNGIKNYGDYDFWIVKLNSNGDMLWQKNYGGSKEDIAYSIQQTSDGGYIAAGSTRSDDFDVIGYHGNNYPDCWIIKLSAKGEIQWKKSYGGTKEDVASSILQTNDGGYVCLGRTESNDGDVLNFHGGVDFWILKLNSKGEIQWQKCIGDSSTDIPNAIQITPDGGYIVSGSTTINNKKVSGHHGGMDAWIVKLNSSGDIQWDKCLGGSVNEMLNSLELTNDGGYILAGAANSNDGDVSGFHGTADFWVVKLNNNGSIQWQKCLGGGLREQASEIKQTKDGGYAVIGYTFSNDGDVSGFKGKTDGWFVKLSPGGDLQWQKCFGGSDQDNLSSLIQENDGSIVIARNTGSTDYNINDNHGKLDLWIIKLSGSTAVDDFEYNKSEIFSVTPNPASGSVIVNFKSAELNNNLQVFNIYGQQLKMLPMTGNEINIDISDFAPGTYFVQLGNIRKKFIKY